MKRREITEQNSDVTMELIGFPKSILRQIRSCSKLAESAKKDIVYLWIKISGKRQIHTVKNEEIKPELDDWLNVVDECAGVGVKWIVLTVDVPLDKIEDAIEICKWAQSAYSMKVGLFLNRESISNKEIEVLKSLRKELTQIFIKKNVFNNFKKLQELGFFLGIADPQEYGEKPNCEGAKKLLFVNPDGSIYTCGLVSGMEKYRMGDIHTRKFKEIVQDPSLPHTVEEGIHKVGPRCDGCPSLLSRFINARSSGQ